MFQTTPEGVTQLEEIRTAWGVINTHTVGKEQALAKLYIATKQIVEGVTTAMNAQEKHNQERELLLRKHDHKLKEVEELFASLRREQWDKQLEEHLRAWGFRSFPKHFGNQQKTLHVTHCKSLQGLGRILQKGSGTPFSDYHIRARGRI